MRSLHERLDQLKRSDPRLGRPASRSPRPVARTLEDLVGGSEATCCGKRYWQLVAPFEQIDREHKVSTKAFAQPLACEGHRGDFTRLDPTQTLVMDIETGGFSGTPVFLIGVVALDQCPLRVEQWLARDYPEEEAILHRLVSWARRRPTWVTFNGKAFDVPFVLDRATIYGVRMRSPSTHVDLLHAARRRWRRELRDYRLETLERSVLGRTRVADVPGCDVPDLFHHFIRTGNAAPLRPVLEHNQLDLVSSTELLLQLATPDHHR